MGESGNLRGISPVIATILMVMITVGLVAFSYTWFMGLGETAKGRVGAGIAGMEKAQQDFSIPTAYECVDNKICFEVRASSMNTLNLDPRELSAYVNDVPKNIENWDGDIAGNSCDATTTLAPGESCYGKVNQTCNTGEVYVLTLSHPWGAEKSVSVRCK